MEFGAGILGGEAPVDGGLGGIALGCIGANGASQRNVVAVAHPQAGAGHDAELNLRHPFGKLRTGLSQLACLGVWWNSNRFTMRLASPAGKVS